MKPPIVCIIDDDEIYQFTAKRTLAMTDMASKILMFNDGEEAIDFLTENIHNLEELPDIIFLDLNMPVMDGWDFIEEYTTLKPKLNKNIILYVVSSSVYDEDIKRAKSISEVTDYIVKPISIDQYKVILTELSGKDN